MYALEVLGLWARGIGGLLVQANDVEGVRCAVQVEDVGGLFGGLVAVLYDAELTGRFVTGPTVQSGRSRGVIAHRNHQALFGQSAHPDRLDPKVVGIAGGVIGLLVAASSVVRGGTVGRVDFGTHAKT